MDIIDAAIQSGNPERLDVELSNLSNKKHLGRLHDVEIHPRPSVGGKNDAGESATGSGRLPP